MRSFMRSAFAIAFASSLLLSAGQAAAAVRGPTGTSQRLTHLSVIGVTNLRGLAAARPSHVSPLAGPRRAELRREREHRAVRVPNPPSTPVTSHVFGFPGLTAAQSFDVNGFDVAPPDQGLCAHGGTVLELVNLAVRAYSESGSPLTRPVSLNAFFGLPPAATTVHDRVVFGPFLTDPRCYFDVQTGRWFATVLEISVRPNGELGNDSAELVAVSQTSDPTGSYRIFSIDSTFNGKRGTSAQANCPCFGDQPRIGADANGFYISADMYPIHGVFNSNGGELWAMSKQGLAAAASGTGPLPAVVDIHVGAVTIDGFPANALQPAETPQGAAYAVNREYFLSTPDFNGFATMGGRGSSAVVLWTLLNTASLAGSSPSVTLTHAMVPSEPFAPPVAAAQKSGPHPLGESLGDRVPPLDAGDDRMEQVEYLNDQVLGSLSTGLGARGTAERTGSAWFDIAASGTSGTMAHQGYVAAPAPTSVLYPAIGLNSVGKGVMTFSLSGRGYFPSAAFVPFSLTTGPGSPITINGPGAAPEDDFTCYEQFTFGPPCRWGDYSAATADGNVIVMATEMVADVPRTDLANWATWISATTP